MPSPPTLQRSLHNDLCLQVCVCFESCTDQLQCLAPNVLKKSHHTNVQCEFSSYGSKTLPLGFRFSGSHDVSVSREEPNTSCEEGLRLSSTQCYKQWNSESALTPLGCVFCFHVTNVSHTEMRAEQKQSFYTGCTEWRWVIRNSSWSIFCSNGQICKENIN